MRKRPTPAVRKGPASRRRRAARRRIPRAAGYHHGDLRAALLARVRDIIRERGVGFVSLREVARRLDVSHGAPAHHFASKAALLTAFATEGYARLAQTVIAEVEAAIPRSGADQLEAVGRGYVRFALQFPEHFGMMFQVDALEVDDPDFVRAGEAAYGGLEAAIGRAGVDGSLGGRDPELVAVGAWSIVHGLASLWLSGRLGDRVRRRDPGALAAGITKLFVDAVLRRA